MTDWKADLDALVQESIAFAKSVAIEPPIPGTLVEPNRMPPVNLNNSERQEIRQRVSNFKAHQERRYQSSQLPGLPLWRGWLRPESRSG